MKNIKGEEVFQLKTKGFTELFKNLDKLEKAIVDEIEDIIKKAAEKIRDEAKEKVPELTGKLKDPIEIKTLEIKKDEIKIGIGPVGDDVFYWFFVEYGTSKMEAQPYLRPAFDNNKKAVEKEIAKGLQKLIRKEGIK